MSAARKRREPRGTNYGNGGMCFLRGLCSIGLLAVVSALPSAGADGWTARVPKPSWIVETTLPTLGETLDSAKWGDRRTLLIDSQVRTTTDSEESFYRRADRVITTTGVSAVSELSYEFDPTYQSLEIHEIWIHREGKKVDVLKPADLKVLQRETDLDRRIYDGTLQVLALLPDVRVGDVVEHSWTLKGKNRAMGGHFSRWWGLGWSWPVARLRLRILTEKSRPLRSKHFNTELRPETTEQAGFIEYRWSSDDLPAENYDDSRPPWAWTQPRVQTSDFTSWSEVAAWETEHYEPRVLSRGDMPASLRTKVEEWEQLETEEARAAAAVRFVQDEVRYLGLEIGESGLIPHAPAVVYERRFGDCKDKSLLLVSILRAMDIEAHIALLHTDWKHTLEQVLPGANVFDHAIAVAQVDGEQVWIDGTKSLQRGPLKARAAPDFRRALIVSEATEALSEMPTTPLETPSEEVLEEFVVEEDGPVAVTITTVSRGAKADATRYSISSWARDDMSEQYLNFYVKSFPDITLGDPPSVADNEEANVVSVVEHYRLPSFWREGRRRFDAWRIEDEMVRPGVVKRKAPLQVRHPSWVRHTIRVTGVGRLDLKDYDYAVKSPGLSFDYKARRSNDGFEVTWELKSLADHVTPDDVEAHINTLDKIHGITGYEVLESGVTNGPPISSGLMYTISFLILAAGVGFFFVKKKRERKVAAFRPGESPQTAIPGSLDEAVPKLRCFCGGRLERADADLTPVQYEDRLLLAATLRCRSCDSEQTCYVAC